ncbi:hypothetical protein C8R45DRAFT_1102795 [Mycena sanguinolenta]|nr:hypothetical protein C8R45DRAFT_1102795 [Mycena sanguinolenta]
MRSPEEGKFAHLSSFYPVSGVLQLCEEDLYYSRVIQWAGLNGYVFLVLPGLFPNPTTRLTQYVSPEAPLSTQGRIPVQPGSSPPPWSEMWALRVPVSRLIGAVAMDSFPWEWIRTLAAGARAHLVCVCGREAMRVAMAQGGRWTGKSELEFAAPIHRDRDRLGVPAARQAGRSAQLGSSVTADLGRSAYLDGVALPLDRDVEMRCGFVDGYSVLPRSPSALNVLDVVRSSWSGVLRRDQCCPGLCTALCTVVLVLDAPPPLHHSPAFAADSPVVLPSWTRHLDRVWTRRVPLRHRRAPPHSMAPLESQVDGHRLDSTRRPS